MVRLHKSKRCHSCGSRTFNVAALACHGSRCEHYAAIAICVIGELFFVTLFMSYYTCPSDTSGLPAGIRQACDGAHNVRKNYEIFMNECHGTAILLVIVFCSLLCVFGIGFRILSDIYNRLLSNAHLAGYTVHGCPCCNERNEAA